MDSNKKYIGPVNKAEIVENLSFDSLSNETAFIKCQLTLILKDGTKLALANPEYFEFKNHPKGREELLKSKLDQKQIDAIMLVWGDKPLLENPPSYG